jgi:hypothetical protein
MIVKEKTLWTQLDGPQARAFHDALWNYAAARFDARFDYFNALAIATANSQHLDFIGKLMKIPRALIIVEQYYYELLRFSSEAGRDSTNGFDIGCFSFNRVFADGVHYQTLDDESYRKILSTLAQTDNHSKGLFLLDVLCDHFLTSRNGVLKKIYYEIHDDPNVTGDIRVSIEKTAGYNQLILEQVLSQIFTSVPKVRLLVNPQLRKGETV